jgi:phosphatidylglycerophosphate synthase
MTSHDLDNRRPLKSRSTGWAQQVAGTLARGGATPDAISGTGLALAVLGAALFLGAGISSPGPRAAFLIGAAACVQLRLLCNLLDGMVAVEHGRGSASGPIWNELPDRLADTLFLVGAGYCAWSLGWNFAQPLGWIAAWLAVLTAYLRELGRGLGFPADFSGPMAKPHRMAALTLTCLVAALEPLWRWEGHALMIGLSVIAVGTAFTLLRRTRNLVHRLAERRAGQP